MRKPLQRMLPITHLLALIALITMAISAHAQPGPASRTLARGGGRTMIQGGTGQPGFVPVITTVAFHAEQQGPAVSGDFECLALAPPVAAGNGSGQFTVNVMYVTGQITSAQVQGDTATLRGTATITGLGAGTNVPFTFVVRRGGPGATTVLTTEGSVHLTFREILVEGQYTVSAPDSSTAHQ